MKESTKNNLGKTYCSKCDTLFDSREKFDSHLPNHLGVACESCPIDIAISKLIKLFKGIRGNLFK